MTGNEAFKAKNIEQLLQHYERHAINAAGRVGTVPNLFAVASVFTHSRRDADSVLSCTAPRYCFIILNCKDDDGHESKLLGFHFFSFLKLTHAVISLLTFS